MRRLIAARAAFAVAILAPFAPAQNATVDHLTKTEILARAKDLQAQAAKGGAASIKLAEYPNHYTMVALRDRSGGAEIHQDYADFFYIVRGRATLLTGGTVVDEQAVSPGEVKGRSIQNGIATALGEGDVVHIPAGVSHQIVLPEKGELVYFVIKVKEK
jgi:mannose-6-phosphate isomerase-like protein (cupin superfamily)